MKALVTGASGFIGSHLCSYLQKRGIEVYATMHRKKTEIKGVHFIHANLLDKKEVEDLIKDIAPTYIFHLAAQSLVLPSWQNTEQTLKVNIFSTLYLLEALVKSKVKTRIVIFCSSSEYAATTKKIKEDFPLSPSSPYALSKIATDNLAFLYYKSFNIDIVRIRPFFIIGPGKIHDVVSDFCRNIIVAENTKKPSITVGNLESIRDFIDIDDTLRAIFLIAGKGGSGDVYNVSSGKGIKVKEILQKLIALSHTKISIIKDRNLFRPIDEPIKIGDNSKLKTLGWTHKISIDDSLIKILQFWRNTNIQG